MNLRKSIKVALAKADKDQKWLADTIGIAPAHVSVIIKRNSANTKTLESVADAFGMKVSELIALGE